MKEIKYNIGDKFLVVKGFHTWDNNFNTIVVSAGTIIEFINRGKSNYEIKNLTNNKTIYFSPYHQNKIISYKEGDEIPDFKNKKAYKIKYNGKFYKPKKFKDMGQIKSSLLITFGYYDKMVRNSDKDKNPDLYFIEIPYWFEGMEQLSLEEFKNVEIVSVENKKETPVTDFNPYEYIKQSQVKLDAICKYGFVVKDMFTKIKDEVDFKYFITITPEKYKESTKDNHYTFYNELEKLEENPIIKETIKELGFKTKDFKKITKYGKTAISVKTEENLFKLMESFKSLNIEVFSTDDENVYEYTKYAKRKLFIHNLNL